MPRIVAKLRKESTKKQRMQRYHAGSLNVVYCLVGTALIYAAASLLIGTALLLFGNPIGWQALLGCAVGIGAIYLYFLVPTLFAVLSDWQVILLPWYKKIVLILAHPVFYMGYIPIMRRALFSGQGRHTWEAIERADFSREEGECS